MLWMAERDRLCRTSTASPVSAPISSLSEQLPFPWAQPLCAWDGCQHGPFLLGPLGALLADASSARYRRVAGRGVKGLCVGMQVGSCIWPWLVTPVPFLPAGAAGEPSRNLRQGLAGLLAPPGEQRQGGSISPEPSPGSAHQQHMQPLLLSLESLWGRQPPSPQAQSPESRLSSFLRNISLYFQGEEEQEAPESWESLLLPLLLPPPNAEKPLSPAASGRWLLQDILFSWQRGSWHWDGWLSFAQDLLSLLLSWAQDPPQHLHGQQGWEVLSSLMEALGQAVLSGLLGSQGSLCPPTGQSGCQANASWLGQLLWLFEGTGWTAFLHIHPAGFAPTDGQLKPLGLVPATPREMPPGNRSEPSLLKTLYRTEQPGTGGKVQESAGDSEGNILWETLEELRQTLWQKAGPTLVTSFRRRVLYVTGLLAVEASEAVGIPQPDPDGKCSVGSLQQLLLWGIRHNISWDTLRVDLASRASFPWPPAVPSCLLPAGGGHRVSETLPPAPRRAFPEPPSQAEVLEAACNESIPGLPGISNFTIYLYCTLFNGSKEPHRPPPDLEALCSSTTWYFSSIEGDPVWIRACKEYFPQQFNSTVCGNASVLLHLGPHQELVEELCANLSMPFRPSRCSEALSRPLLGQEDFWTCLSLENQTLWTQNLCSSSSLREVSDAARQWLGTLCHSPLAQGAGLNASLRQSMEAAGCGARAWSPQALHNTSFLAQCGDAHLQSFQELVCSNKSLLEALQLAHPWVRVHCLAVEQDRSCSLPWLPGVLPLPPQLCQDAPAFLTALVSQLAWCKEPPHSSSQWAPSAGYLLRLLDFLLASPALGEVGQEGARQQLGQALLLSSLLHNSSFGTSLQANFSLSILEDVSQFLQEGELDPATKEDLLNCFGPLLWNLLEREENISALEFFMQEYLQMPHKVVQRLLWSAEGETIQRFLALLHRSWDHLQMKVPPWDERAVESLAAQLLSKFPQPTPQLFLHLSHFVPFMAASDILRLPSALLANDSVLAIISSQSARMTLAQKRALVQRLLQAEHLLGKVPSWPPEFLHILQPLLPHLPLGHFLQLTPQQIQSLVNGWQEAELGLAQGRHVARSLLNRSHESTEEQMCRLGALTCFLSIGDLRLISPLQDLWGPIEKHLLECVARGVVDPHGQLAHALAELLPSSVGSHELQSWRGLVPAMGVEFLRGLSESQVGAILPELQAAQLSRAQALLLLSQALRMENVTLSGAEPLCSLLAGLGPQSLEVAVAAVLARGCACVGPTLPHLSGAQKAGLLQALQRYGPESPVLSAHLDCLLPAVPLKLLQVDTQALLGRSSWHRKAPWSPQQAQFLWQSIEASANMTGDLIWGLGHLAMGLSCTALQTFEAGADFLAVLEALYSQDLHLPWSLKGCIWEEIQRRPSLSTTELLGLGPQFLMDLPTHLLDKLPGKSFLLILDYVRSHPHNLLVLPPPRRAALARHSLQALLQRSQGEADISVEILSLLGPLVGFLEPDNLVHANPANLLQHLDELRETCLDNGVAEVLGQLLMADGALGDPGHWSQVELEQLGHLVFRLPPESTQRIPQAVLSKDLVEQLLQSQKLWEESEQGQLCDPQGPGGGLQAQKEALVRRSLEGSQEEPVPSCSDIRASFPSAWSATQISAMELDQFHDCLSLISQDLALRPYQRQAALSKAKEVSSPPDCILTPEVEMLQLGFLALQLSEEELQELEIPDWGALSVLGGLEGWTERQPPCKAAQAFYGCRQDTRTPSFQFLFWCRGLHLPPCTPATALFLPHSKAASFLGLLHLSCSEEKLEALAWLLVTPAAFGPVAMWGPGIFTEIGTLAAGLPDIVLSSLVPEQLRALTPEAVALIPAPKFAVVFSPAQLLSLTSPQASAVTAQQYGLLSPKQKWALELAQCEGEPCQDYRSMCPPLP
ncbi:Stereocilin [Podarcis lilfordi]|uniref:Stereocilin n=1 Tax=Podarcis lilfordi TaxID=74358 RepID=A0AA35LB32_9SAUR|nr:Stereocilin [Podarcis lilfordi]